MLIKLSAITPNPTPPIHAILTTVTTPVQSVPPFKNADPTFTARSPLLAFSKPASLLNSSNGWILCRPIRNRDMLHAHFLYRGLL
jgi:hypothetical protein